MVSLGLGCVSGADFKAPGQHYWT